MPEITPERMEHTADVLTENFLSRLSAMVAELDSHDSRHDPTGERGPMPLFGLFDGLVSRFNDEVPSPKPLRRADLEAYALLGSMIFGTDLESEQDGSYVEDALTVANAALTAPRSRGMEYLFFAVAIVAARLTEQQKAKDAATHAEGDTQKPCQPCPS